jgi:hypothetical protein
MSKCKTRQDWELAVQFSAWSEICFSQKYIPRIRLTVHMVTGYIVISQLLYSLIQSVLCKFHGRAVHKSLLLWYECTAVHCTGYSFVLELEVCTAAHFTSYDGRAVLKLQNLLHADFENAQSDSKLPHQSRCTWNSTVDLLVFRHNLLYSFILLLIVALFVTAHM